MNQPNNVTVVQVQSGSNGLGLAGLVFSILGWVTCGVLSIPGAILSFMGLFFTPRGTAIAGLIVGFPGVLFFFLVGMGIIGGILGLAPAVEAAREAARKIEMEAARQSEALEAQGEATSIAESQPGIDLQESPPSVPEPQTAESQPNATADVADPIADPVVPAAVPESPATEVATETDPAELAELAAAETELFSDPSNVEDPRSIVRTFADRSGKFSVEATVIEVSKGNIQLKRVDTGKVVTVPIERLSQDDQEWIQTNFPQDSNDE